MNRPQAQLTPLLAVLGLLLVTWFGLTQTASAVFLPPDQSDLFAAKASPGGHQEIPSLLPKNRGWENFENTNKTAPADQLNSLQLRWETHFDQLELASGFLSYADGNPISMNDPFGLCAESGWGRGGQFAKDFGQGLVDYTWRDMGRDVGTVIGGAAEIINYPFAVSGTDPMALGPLGGAEMGLVEGMASLGVLLRGAAYADDLAVAANTIDSAAVRFSQSSISRNFSAGGTIDDLATGLRSGSVNPTSIPPIRLVEREGSMFTLDNRRLWSFQQAEVPVPYRMATPQEAAAEAWKFTTPNGGNSIRVRGQ